MGKERKPEFEPASAWRGTVTEAAETAGIAASAPKRIVGKLATILTFVSFFF